MILNKHIRNDYGYWGVYPVEKTRVTTLCGKITAPKYAGVPGLDKDQVAGVFGEGDLGWCLGCCQAFLLEMLGLEKQIQSTGSGEVIRLYHNAIVEVTAQVNRLKAHTSVN